MSFQGVIASGHAGTILWLNIVFKAKASENKAQKYKCCFLECSITYSCVLIVLDEIVHAFNGYIFT